MKTTTWDPVAGGQHLAQFAATQGAALGFEWVPATYDAARNTVLSAMFAAESLVYAIGKKPLPSASEFAPMINTIQVPGLALPMASQGSTATIGDGLDFLSAADRDWPADSAQRTVNQVIAMYLYATNRACRQLVRSARPTNDPPNGKLADNNSVPAPATPQPGEALGAVPVGIILLGVLGVAAIAASAWAATEIAKPVTAMHIQEAAITAQLAFDTQVALAQIQSGQPVTVSKIAEQYANQEKMERTYVPLVVGGLAVAGIAGALIEHFVIQPARKSNPSRRSRRRYLLVPLRAR